MGAARQALCMALDPLPDVIGSGRQINRHCLLPAGHDAMHETRTPDGVPVHSWMWDESDSVPALMSQGRLF